MTTEELKKIYEEQNQKKEGVALATLHGSKGLEYDNVYLIDECDGYRDAELSESYVMMLYNMMSVLKVEQCFMISHHVTDNSCSNIIHVLNLSEEIKKESEK